MIKLRAITIFILDTLIFFGSLALVLLIRYGPNRFWLSFFRHLPLFLTLFVFWIAIFYLFDLYHLKIFKGKAILLKKFFLALIFCLLISVIFLYVFGPFFQLTPKINLLLFSAIFFLLDYFGRLFLNKIFFIEQKIPILFLGESPVSLDLIAYLKSNPQFGYKVISSLKENEINAENIKKLFLQEKIEIAIISPSFEKKDDFLKLFYYFSPKNIEFIDFRDFYEMIYQKEPLELLDEAWFIEKLRPTNLYNFLKRTFDIFMVFIALLFFSLLILLGIFLVKISSPGPIFFKQKVLGKNNKIFILYKLRTMKEGNSYPLWTMPGDERITKIGKFLRFSHIDELPQLYNILKGNLSFVGPRPERIELVQMFEEKLPYYAIRRVIKPGFTGWAQINYKPSASIDEVYEKLKYDFYYLKNRSLWLDSVIFLKTIRLLVGFPK